MKKEFDLSKKACYLGDIIPNLVMYKKEDVKEFIRLLKEEIFFDIDIMKDKIDKLAGEKLK